jgi:hypothetical protein
MQDGFGLIGFNCSQKCRVKRFHPVADVRISQEDDPVLSVHRGVIISKPGADFWLPPKLTPDGFDQKRLIRHCAGTQR